MKWVMNTIAMPRDLRSWMIRNSRSVSPASRLAVGSSSTPVQCSRERLARRICPPPFDPPGRTPCRGVATGAANEPQFASPRFPSVRNRAGSRRTGVSRFQCALGREIVGGIFPPGSLLPSAEEMCARFSVSRTALREAYSQLTAKALIVARPKVGTGIRPRADWNLFDPDVLAWHLQSAPTEFRLRSARAKRETDLFEIAICQLGQNVSLDLAFAKRRLVLAKPEPAQPSPDIRNAALSVHDRMMGASKAVCPEHRAWVVPSGPILHVCRAASEWPIFARSRRLGRRRGST
jgi:hypothetical protein